ncbi:Homeobox domain-containing protein/HALZ domain-containing protein/HD-ZIP_N domain-containing protein [Cephalotus follicularis]|uniref:Homeobox domain-containing protein/HALZ domain-containing protein/HD-ZIP_N domain-containing protein n=1 Tax=Cephalotus follicularis TaxID=3775 RepID=A0A1Q3CQB3_CEPFO|nr:Homeobox domain-containing protein/HALZ domain-containing protein/HD-ZIP_N domain-containing protein [Cephalotus follicularis]
MGEKDGGLGLGLSLGLGCAPKEPSLKLNLMPMPFSSQLMRNQNQKISWNDLFPSADDTEQNSDTRTILRGIDVNRTPSTADCEEENGDSSPNSTVSSISGKRSEREPIGDETEAERASCSRESDDEDGGGGGEGSRKKLRLSKEQSMVLEETFKDHSTLNPKQKLALAKQLNLRPRQVEVWFQNRRARTKLKQTEVDCEYLKRCCENLTEDNRRLQKEVQELRALKLSPQLYMHMNPPTTLTMCPSCERVAVTSSSTSAATSSTPTPTIPSRHLMASNQQRPVPINPWAALQIRTQTFDAPASRS